MPYYSMVKDGAAICFLTRVNYRGYLKYMELSNGIVSRGENREVYKNSGKENKQQPGELFVSGCQPL